MFISWAKTLCEQNINKRAAMSEDLRNNLSVLYWTNIIVLRLTALKFRRKTAIGSPAF